MSFRNIKWMIDIAYKNCKRVLLFCVLTATLEVLLNLTQLYIAPGIIKCVEQKNFNKGTTNDNTCIYISFICH